MHDFLLVFEFVDESVFKTLYKIREHLDIVCRGKYKLDVEFNNKKLKLNHKLLGLPALINKANHKVIYGTQIEREELKEIL